MRKWLLLFGVILLTKPDGGPVWIVVEQVAGVLSVKHVGATDAAIVTLGGTFYVREPPEEVAAKLGWK